MKQFLKFAKKSSHTAMKGKIIFFVFLSLNLILKAQVVDIVSGDDLSKSVPRASQYLFDDFTEGRVQFRTGTFGIAKMNYNTLLGEMQFVDVETGNVLSFENIANISSIMINGRFFIPARSKDEFLEVLVPGEISLAVKYKADVVSVSKEGAYGSVSTAITGSSYYSTLSEETRPTQQLTTREQFSVKLSSICFLVKEGKPVSIKGVRTFLNTYPKNKAPTINRYVEEYRINFDSKESLMKFTRFINEP